MTIETTRIITSPQVNKNTSKAPSKEQDQQIKKVEEGPTRGSGSAIDNYAQIDGGE